MWGLKRRRENGHMRLNDGELEIIRSFLLFCFSFSFLVFYL